MHLADTSTMSTNASRTILRIVPIAAAMGAAFSVAFVAMIG